MENNITTNNSNNVIVKEDFSSNNNNNSNSIFDSIRHFDDNGNEYWSARELQGLLGYERWERFDDAIERAKVAIKNTGQIPEQQVRDAAKLQNRGNRGATQEVKDYHLTRYGCYMVAMNGDPRKEEIAAAQTYFAVKTRQAETQQEKPLSAVQMFIMATKALEEHETRLTTVESTVQQQGVKLDSLVQAHNGMSMYQAFINNDNKKQLDEHEEKISVLEKQAQDNFSVKEDISLDIKNCVSLIFNVWSKYHDKGKVEGMRTAYLDFYSAVSEAANHPPNHVNSLVSSRRKRLVDQGLSEKTAKQKITGISVINADPHLRVAAVAVIATVTSNAKRVQEAEQNNG